MFTDTSLLFHIKNCDKFLWDSCSEECSTYIPSIIMAKDRYDEECSTYIPSIIMAKNR